MKNAQPNQQKVSLYHNTRKACDEHRPTERILDDLYDNGNFPARQAVTVDMHNILH